MSKELKVLELFSGIGSQHKALTNIGIKSICTQCDIDKYAIQAYNAIHGETENLGNISLIDESKFVRDQWDLVTYSSPCQDFSFAGLQAGGEKGSGTRSSLLWEVEKIVKQVHPKYLLMENVKALVSKKFLSCFEKWIETLNSYGYKTYWKVLNAKNYGIPQNRERVFAVSIRNDIDQSFEFPSEQKLEKRLKDVLESNVDAKYYLSKQVQDRFKFKPKGDNIIGTTMPESRTIGQRDVVFGTDGLMGSLVATDYKQPKQIIEYTNNEPIIVASRGRNPNNPNDRTVGELTEQRLEPNSQGIANTLTSVQKDNYVLEPKIETLGNYKPSGYENDIKTMYNPYNDYRIRKLTPRECYRLMGFSDEDFDKVKSVGMSDTQCYKQAGNSIVVNCLMAIFTNMFKDTDYMDSSENRGVH